MTDYTAPWYHGSPSVLTVLQKGSWITQVKEIAKAFAHKPTIISMSDDGETVKHDGTLPAYLYIVAEPITPDDVALLPKTAMTHWQTQRDLAVTLLQDLPVSDPPQLTEAELADLKQIRPDAGEATGLYGDAAQGE